MAGLGAQDPVSAPVAPAPLSLVARRGPWDLATPALSRPDQASQWTNGDNKYTKMKLQPRSTILDGSWEPVIVPNDGT